MQRQLDSYRTAGTIVRGSKMKNLVQKYKKVISTHDPFTSIRCKRAQVKDSN